MVTLPRPVRGGFVSCTSAPAPRGASINCAQEGWTRLYAALDLRG